MEERVPRSCRSTEAQRLAPVRIMTDTGRSSQERILSALGSGSLRLTEISAAMGYLGITKKLSDTVGTMVLGGLLVQFTGPQGRLLYRII